MIVVGPALAFAFLALAPQGEGATDWKPAKGPLATRWAADVKPDRVLPEYPRPQLVRSEWLNLNGIWEYAIRPREEARPENFDGRILVPFPVESALSGVMKPVKPEHRLWYRRTFELPARGEAGRWLLHFGAVDWDTTVMVNGKAVGEHRGGFDPFTFDITEAIVAGKPQELIVSVWDPTDQGSQPRGKQVLKPGGIMYTANTGIWQTVWLEPVPETRVDTLRIVPDIDAGEIRVTPTVVGPRATGEVSVTGLEGHRPIGTATGSAGSAIAIKVPDAKLWAPDHPFLYGLKARTGNDEVRSYFGMRKIAMSKDEHGVNRLMLNGKSVFQLGPLDQGWWPDGLYTAPTDEALKFDIEITRKLGFNMIRKHVKVEPERWYYWCDTLGILVWQDMPSGDNKDDASKVQFMVELERLIDARENHPSIIMWVPFNEGWGQHDTPRYVDWIKRRDPSRLVNNASGWTDTHTGDLSDVHVYPGPGMPATEPGRVAVLGEFGGLGLPLGRQGQLGLSNLQVSGRASAGIRGPDPAAPRARRDGAQRGRLHPDDRLRDRGQRPADLRPGGGQDSDRDRRARPRRDLQALAHAQRRPPHSLDRSPGLEFHDEHAVGRMEGYRRRRCRVATGQGGLRNEGDARRDREYRVEIRGHLAAAEL